MGTAIRAIYQDGVFRPLEATQGVANNEVLELQIRPLPPVISDPNIMGGKPCISGTRMPIDWVVGYLECGRTLDQFLQDYPQYRREQVIAAIGYAVKKMGYTDPLGA